MFDDGLQLVTHLRRQGPLQVEQRRALGVLLAAKERRPAHVAGVVPPGVVLEEDVLCANDSSLSFNRSGA